MLRAITVGFVALLSVPSPLFGANPIRGKYVEARTCQVYTGPCFANGEVGSTGKDAILTWSIDAGSFNGVDLSGHSAALIVKTSHTLGFNGFDDAAQTKAVVFVDAAADARQQRALQSFVLTQTGVSEKDVARLQAADIDLQFDVDELTATVKVGDIARLQTRKARKGDCICSNESAYYPPLTPLLASVPGVTIEGEVSARALSSRWSIPDSRTAYMGLFSVDASDVQLASTN